MPRLARLGHLQQCLPLRRPLLCAVPLGVVQQQQVELLQLVSSASILSTSATVAAWLSDVSIVRTFDVIQSSLRGMPLRAIAVATSRWFSYICAVSMSRPPCAMNVRIDAMSGSPEAEARQQVPRPTRGIGLGVFGTAPSIGAPTTARWMPSASSGRARARLSAPSASSPGLRQPSTSTRRDISKAGDVRKLYPARSRHSPRAFDGLRRQ